MLSFSLSRSASPRAKNRRSAFSAEKRAITLIAVLAALSVRAQGPEQWAPLEKTLNFYVANDLGRNGYYDQKTIADLMGRMAEVVDIEFVAAPGDIHHFNGVQSTQDPLWMTNYELIYSHPDLMLDWYPLLGNHEYRSNTQACIDYSNISARWRFPSRYYTRVITTKDSLTLRLVMVDTSPLIDKYREDTEEYPDAQYQDPEAELAWVDSVLTVADEDWVVVMGHHPIYADTGKDTSERADMQKRLDPILRAHPCVSFYVCGHIHTFQHIRMPGSDIDYVVNTSGSLARTEVNDVEGTQFKSTLSGFSLMCADKQSLDLHFIDKDGNVVYTISRTK